MKRELFTDEELEEAVVAAGIFLEEEEGGGQTEAEIRSDWADFCREDPEGAEEERETGRRYLARVLPPIMARHLKELAEEFDRKHDGWAADKLRFEAEKLLRDQHHEVVTAGVPQGILDLLDKANGD